MAPKILPCKYISRAYNESGTYNYASPSLQNSVDNQMGKGVENIVISSIIVDKIANYSLSLVNSDGFHPRIVNINVNTSVLFDWSSSNQSHNIVHYKLPDERNFLELVTGPKAFTSGNPVTNKSFLYTFEVQGSFCVMSEGAKDEFCVINVVDDVTKTSKPELVNQDPYVLYRYHRIYLHCHTPDSIIHYTVDGTTPNKLSSSYNRENGIIMDKDGIFFVRAIAYSDEYAASDIFTSQYVFFDYF
jgi:plastocyanin